MGQKVSVFLHNALHFSNFWWIYTDFFFTLKYMIMDQISSF